jgi:hypothetical protein
MRAMHRFMRWREVIQGATDEKSLLRIMRDYVDSIDPTVISALPSECQRALADLDIQSAAVTLLHCEMSFKGLPEMTDLLHEIAHTYSAASLRLAQLSQERTSPRGE